MTAPKTPDLQQDRIAQASQRMASVTMLLLIAMLVFSIGGWLFPQEFTHFCD
ncbi:hypothetical protein [Collimonas humicola]